MERGRNQGKPQQHFEFAKIRRQIAAHRLEGVQPTEDQVLRLRELDDWLALNTNYWHRHYEKPKPKTDS